MNKLVDAYMDTLPEFAGPDPLELEVDVLRDRLGALETQVAQMAINALTMAKVIHELREQSTGQPQSSIILPDRFN